MSAPSEARAPERHSEQTDPPLRAGATVTTDERGRLVGTVELHGELCAGSAELLRSELERLLDVGVADLTIDLRQLRLCSSQGLDVFDDIHARLEVRDGGLRLVGAGRAVRRVLRLVADHDPTFRPSLRNRAAG